MYEMTSAIVAEPSLRSVRQRALPSLQRERLHDRELRLRDTMQAAVATSSAASDQGRGTLGRAAALLARLAGIGAPRPGHAAAA